MRPSSAKGRRGVRRGSIRAVGDPEADQVSLDSLFEGDQPDSDEAVSVDEPSPLLRTDSELVDTESGRIPPRSVRRFGSTNHRTLPAAPVPKPEPVVEPVSVVEPTEPEFTPEPETAREPGPESPPVPEAEAVPEAIPEPVPPGLVHPPGTRRSHRRWLYVGAPAVVALAVVAAIAVNAGRHPGRTSSVAGASSSGGAATSPASNLPTSTGVAAGSGTGANIAVPVVEQRIAMLTWVGNNLSRSAVIVGDSAAVSQLDLAGFSNAVSFDNLKGVELQTVDYVLDASGQSDPTPTQRQLLASSSPVAIFGSGPNAVSARQVFPTGVSALAARQVQDGDIRRRGGLELTRNPSVQMDGQIATLLQAGQLDLRALNVLNTLATERPVWLTQILTDANEQRAGLPPRSIVITTEDPQDVQNLLASMPAPYKPDTVIAISQTKFRLSWKPAIAPVAVFGN